MHRPPKNHTVCLASVSLPRGWGLNLVVIMEIKVNIGEKEVIIIIVKEFVMGICTLKLNLFELITRVSYHRVYRQELKLIATCLTTL